MDVIAGQGKGLPDQLQRASLGVQHEVRGGLARAFAEDPLKVLAHAVPVLGGYPTLHPATPKLLLGDPEGAFRRLVCRDEDPLARDQQDRRRQIVSPDGLEQLRHRP